MEHILMPSPWEPYCEEGSHYSYVRCLSFGALYEVVRVTHDKHDGQAQFVHQVIFMGEYDEQAMTEILKGFGYESLDSFVCEVNHADVDPDGFIIRPDGSIDRDASRAWWIDYMLLASLMAEHFPGREMTAKAADALAKAIVEAPCDAFGPFCIRRTWMDQLMSIPLTEDEVNAICTVKDEQARMENLCGELRDLGEDDPCFEGHDLQELINDQKFLHAVMDRWYHYNGHGGDQTENLREAVTVTIHELFSNMAGGDGR